MPNKTDIQFKDDLRKELIMYKHYLELLTADKKDELLKMFQEQIDRIEKSLQD